MSELTKDPVFRNQYEGQVKEDDEFQAALAGALPPARLPIGNPIQTQTWLPPLKK